MEEAKEEGVLCTFAKTTQVHHYQVYFRYIFPKTSSLLYALTASCILSTQRTRIEFWILSSKMLRILFLITTLICCLQINAQDRPVQFPDQPGGSSQTGGQPGGSSQTGGKPDFSQTGGQPGGSSQTGGQPGGSSQTGGQPGGSSQTGGQPGGSSQTGGQPGGSSQTGGQPGGSSQTGGQPGGSSQVGGNIFRCIFISIKNLSIE